jgi:hypothetical protein
MSKHDNDFYGWTQETAELLKQGRFSEVDINALIEEVEDMGKSEWRELESRLSVLLIHLLKWTYQPDYISKSWQRTIRHQRDRVHRLVRKNPSLKPQFAEVLESAYKDAAFNAEQEANLKEGVLPNKCPWSIEQVLDDEFYPGVFVYFKFLHD